MIEIHDENSLNKFLKLNGVKLLYIYAPRCPSCEISNSTFKECHFEISLLVSHIGKIKIDNCGSLCDDNDITGTPTILLYDDHGSEISRLNFAPDIEDLIMWIVAITN